ncbi:MAG: hypothetical protein JNJ85_12560 [Candidatus Kapabacteria bacterium]|nr:hypothetical protein [Candidatus Kapabacteria bacterium]
MKRKKLNFFAYSVSGALLLSCLLITASVQQVHAQGEAQIRSILGKFKNYRYGNISIFKVDDESMRSIVQLLNPEPLIPDAAKNCAAAKQSQIDDKVAELGCAATLDGLLEDPEIKKLLRGECMEYAKFAVNKMSWQCNTFKRAYVVTTRFIAGQPFKVVALITSNSESKKLTTVLGTPRDIYTYTQLRQSAAPAGSPAKTLYEYLSNFVIQQNEADGVNVTAEAQGLGEEQFLKKVYGLALQVEEDDVAGYVRTSEGQAMDYSKPRELVVSPDLISYRDYSPADPSVVKEGYVYNRTLPKYGVELRYGVDQINHPSFFSERVALNAVWGVNRLGVILPTSGWSSLGKQFGVERRLTHAGWGLNANFDFPLKITNASTGVFNISGGYVFGDAVKSDHQVGSATSVTETYTRVGVTTDSLKTVKSITTAAKDYLIRFNAQAHYTFAISIDSGNFFRFRIGAGVYARELWVRNAGSTTVQKWKNAQVVQGSDSTYSFDTFTRMGVEGEPNAIKYYGGISGRVEYMSMYVSTPYGFGVQYFDESIMGEAWLLVPINTNLGLRFDGKISRPLLRDPYAWESNTIFAPSMRIIYNF